MVKLIPSEGSLSHFLKKNIFYSESYPKGYFFSLNGYFPGGHLYLKLDIVLVKKKKNHVGLVRIVFQEQAMYCRVFGVNTEQSCVGF